MTSTSQDTTQPKQLTEEAYPFKYESVEDIERELEQTFKSYALANPNSFFDRTDSQFKIVATAFIERVNASARREYKALVTSQSQLAVEGVLERLEKEAVYGTVSYTDTRKADVARGGFIQGEIIPLSVIQAERKTNERSE